MTTLALVVSAAAVIVIGLGVSLAAFPAGAVCIATRIASIFGLGCAAVIFSGTLLVLLGAFQSIFLAVLLTVITGAAYVVAFRRAGARDHLNALREEFAADRVFLLLGLGALVLVAASWLAVPELSMPGGWRYWSDGLELADRGGVPQSTTQWGAARPPETSKLGGSAFLGALSFVFREQPFAGMSLALWLSVVGYAAGLFALARELGLRWLAPALPLLGITGSRLPAGIVLNWETGWKFTLFQNEDLGSMLAAVAAAIILASSSERFSLERLIAGGILLVAAALAHLIPVIVFGAFIAGVLVARAAVRRHRRHAAFAGGALVMAGVMTVALLALARGEVGWQEAGSSGRYTLSEGKYDPTAKMNGLNRRPRPKSERRWYQPPGTVMRLAAEAAVGRDLTRMTVMIVLFLAVLATAATLAFGSVDVRFLIAGTTAMAVAILGIALLFSYRYSLYLPAIFGKRRLFDYLPLVLTLLGLAVVETVAARIAQRWAIIGRAIAVASVLAVALGTAGGLGAASKPESASYVRAAVLTPCDSRLLVDRDTHGTFQALTGRISVTEGLIPFLRPAILDDVLRLREATDQFFADPEGSARILSEQEVDFVIAEINPALDATGELELMRTVDGLAVYTVERAPSSRDLPRPPESAGYHCFTEVPR
jgi:hypothetical protein